MALHFLSVSLLDPEDGTGPVELDVYNFKGPGIALAMYNVDEVGHVFIFFVRIDLAVNLHHFSCGPVDYTKKFQTREHFGQS